MPRKYDTCLLERYLKARKGANAEYVDNLAKADIRMKARAAHALRFILKKEKEGNDNGNES